MSPHRLPRMVATDLDGTIVRGDYTVDGRTGQVLRRLERAGVVVVLVSGRPPRWMPPIAEAVGHAGTAVCANGALLYDLRTGEIVGSHLIDLDTLRAASELLRTAFPDIAFAVEYGFDFTHEPEYRHEFDIGVEVRIERWPDLLRHPAAKLLARCESIDPDTLLAKAEDLVGDLVTVTHSSRVGLLEVSALGVTKATGLARLATRHGIEPADVLAFGDMPNDLAMLTWAGRSVAVANAHPDVLDAVDDVTAEVEDSGVARYLERLLQQ